MSRNILKCQDETTHTIEEWDAMVAEGYDALPQEMKDYIAKIEEYLQQKIIIVSVGAERMATIVREPIWD